MRITGRFRRPSTGTLLGLLALFVALGGTALAATGQLVNITDGSNPANVAKVSNSGALTVAGTTTITLPNKPITGNMFLASGFPETLLGPTSATVVLQRIGATNYTEQEAGQRASFTIFKTGVDGSGACNASSEIIASYDLDVSDTIIDPLGPQVLKAPAGSTKWCLKAQADMTNPGSTYYEPNVFFDGYVAAGTLTGAGALSTQSAPSLVAKPPLHRP